MKLILLDANALVHRAYHAIPPNLTSPTGEPTNATYGFAATLLKVLAEEKPDYIAAAFDVGPSFRREHFAAYKATRPRLGDDLAIQLGRSREVAEAFGIPTFGVEGYEADDLLGTLSRQATEAGVDTVIVTGDTDTFQLIGPHVKVLTFSRQFGELVLYDEQAIRERYQLEPSQLIDLKALRGDPSDNIPGIPGVGDKTATRLLQSFQSVEGILEHLDSVDGKTRDKLAAARNELLRDKMLVTIKTDAPARLDLKACRVAAFDRERVLALFRELGFRSLVDRLPSDSASSDQGGGLLARPDSNGAEPAVELQPNYRIVGSLESLDRLVEMIRPGIPIAIDVETTNTDAMKAELVGIAIATGKAEAFYIPIAGATIPAPVPLPVEVSTAPARKGRNGRKASENAAAEQLVFETRVEHAAGAEPAPAPGAKSQIGFEMAAVLDRLRPILEDETIPKYGHNAKYDLTVFAEAGVEVRGLAFDTMVAAHLLEPNGQSLGLKSLVWSKFGWDMPGIETLIGKGKNQITMAQVDLQQAARYACSDVDYTERLVQIYRPQLVERGLDRLFEEVEMPLVPALIEMERTGVLLDIEFLHRMSGQLTERLQELEKRIQEQVGAPINIASPQQLADALFNKLKLPTQGLPKTKTGQFSTAAEVLESLRGTHSVIELILEHRELAKLKGTYVDALPALVNPKTGRVHTDYNQTGTVTGRVSSSNPNLQNIPIRTDLGRQVRRAFIAPVGSQLVSADYSQVELRILAHVTRDPNLLEAFARGEDIHAATAARLYRVPLNQVTPEMRRVGKTINFGIAYGITGFGIAARTDLTQDQARKMIEQYFQEYPKIKEYVEETKLRAREQGFVQTPLGRRRYFPELASTAHVHPSLRSAAEREAVNMPIQGTAADIIKIAMVRLHRELHARGLRSRMILQVHDELVLECPDDEIHLVAPLVREVMENAYPLVSKLKVELSAGQNWDGMLPVE
jgi:DNA polymerase-1